MEHSIFTIKWSWLVKGDFMVNVKYSTLVCFLSEISLNILSPEWVLGLLPSTTSSTVEVWYCTVTKCYSLASSDPNRQLLLTTISLSFSKMITVYRLRNIKDPSHIKEWERKQTNLLLMGLATSLTYNFKQQITPESSFWKQRKTCNPFLS